MFLKKSTKFIPGIILAYIFYLFSIVLNNIIGTELLGVGKKSNFNCNDSYSSWNYNG